MFYFLGGGGLIYIRSWASTLTISPAANPPFSSAQSAEMEESNTKQPSLKLVTHQLTRDSSIARTCPHGTTQSRARLCTMERAPQTRETSRLVRRAGAGGWGRDDDLGVVPLVISVFGSWGGSDGGSERDAVSSLMGKVKDPAATHACTLAIRTAGPSSFSAACCCCRRHLAAAQ